ncbi:hypothetical protein PIB30_012381 [Stylosanthes scabra]|uniref:RING-type domain-containing protein n=1 Tax=Stylosanthes scabra TaxID=79078 RepID=A0ABU6Q5Y5_9FABA|nr:hypothetical protein [Stylosanthes scabra]
MAHTSYSLEIASRENPTAPPECCFSDCFSINLTFTIEFIQVDIDLSSSTTFREAFLVPWDILCNCTPLTDFNGQNAEILHDIFSSVHISYELLDEILPHLAESARTILSGERCGSLEMDVNLHVVMHIADEDFEIFNDDEHRENVSEVGQVVTLMERLKVDVEEDGDEQCAICLEELFGDGNEDSSGEVVVRTNCSHVFHERCILRWIERCIKCESPYSCPLCRCNMIPNSEGDDE